MAAITVVAAAVALVKADPNGIGPSAPTGAAVTAGKVVRHNSSGEFVHAQADSEANAGARRGIAIDSRQAGAPLSPVFAGLVDLGAALDALADGAPVFLSAAVAGGLDTAAGASSTLIGYVEMHYGATTVQRLLRVIDNQDAGTV